MSLDRIVAYLRRAEEGVVDEVHTLRHTTALLTPSLPLVWSLNALRVDDPEASVDTLVAAADDVLGHLSHRKLVVNDQQLGARLAPKLASTGWNVYRLLVMVRERAAERTVPAGIAGKVDRAAGAAALAAFRREQPFGWQEEAVQQLTAMDERFERVAHAHDFVAPLGEPAAACRLYTADGLAQIDEVGTIEAERGRGYASAAVLAAVESAEAQGCDPVFLLTDAADWPQQLYARLGFAPIGEVYDFLKLPLASPRP